jgi:formate hydrogenlyase subunit 3/multisubunit Na+/H+ antiporter MnhD subunit
MSALPLIVDAIVAWLAIGLLALVPTGGGFIGRSLFVAGALVGLAISVIALTGIGDVAQTMVLPLGLPDLPFHVRLDALSAFFLVLLGAAAAGISVFSAGYFNASFLIS